MPNFEENLMPERKKSDSQTNVTILRSNLHQRSSIHMKDHFVVWRKIPDTRFPRAKLDRGFYPMPPDLVCPARSKFLPHAQFFKMQRGSGLLEVIVMSSIIVVIILGLSKLFVNYNKFELKMSYKRDNFLLKKDINEQVGCFRTLKDLGFTCNPGDNVQISKYHLKHPEVLIKAGSDGDLSTFTRFHDIYLVRAKCETCSVSATCINGRRIKVEKRRVSRTGVTPIKHFTDWSNLYNRIPFKCIF